MQIGNDANFGTIVNQVTSAGGGLFNPAREIYDVIITPTGGVLFTFLYRYNTEAFDYFAVRG